MADAADGDIRVASASVVPAASHSAPNGIELVSGDNAHSFSGGARPCGKGRRERVPFKVSPPLPFFFFLFPQTFIFFSFCLAASWE